MTDFTEFQYSSFGGTKSLKKVTNFKNPSQKALGNSLNYQSKKTVMKYSINKDLVLFLEFYAHQKLDSNLIIFEL